MSADFFYFFYGNTMIADFDDNSLIVLSSFYILIYFIFKCDYLNTIMP